MARTDLVVAVSEAGGLGVLGGVSHSPDELRDAIREIRSRTDKPFGIDLIMPEQLLEKDPEYLGGLNEARASISREKYDLLGELRTLIEPDTVWKQLEVIVEEAPPVFVSALGNPGVMVPALHARGVTVMSVVGTVKAARACVDNGVDVVIAQGTEAGGHTGSIATMALVPQVVDAVEVPVIGAGGIADGRGLAAALCLGAQAVWMGTRFVATVEAFGHERYKNMILESEAPEAVISRAYSGKTIRTFRNEWVREYETKEAAKFPFQIVNSNERLTAAMVRGDLNQGLAPVGQVCGLIRELRSAADIVREVVSEAASVLRGVSGLVLGEEVGSVR